MPETFFHTPVASVQPAATKSGGSNDLAIARINFYFKTSDRWKIFQEIGNETLTDFFGKFSRLENAFGMVEHIVKILTFWHKKTVCLSRCQSSSQKDLPTPLQCWHGGTHRKLYEQQNAIHQDTKKPLFEWTTCVFCE